mgnify:CR=1 FL=1
MPIPLAIFLLILLAVVLYGITHPPTQHRKGH